MYNRYIRDDKGVYTRIPQEEPARQDAGQLYRQNSRKEETPLPKFQSEQSVRNQGAVTQEKVGKGSPKKESFEPPRYENTSHGDRKSTTGGVTDSLTGFLRQFLDKFHLDHVDTGDLLLLGLLFFLFREDADEELLTALGLLLIL